MFSSKNLIATPQRFGGNQNQNKIDFTPIGKSKRSVAGHHAKTNSTYNNNNNNNFNSSFDHTGDDFFMDSTVNSFKQQASTLTSAHLPSSRLTSRQTKLGGNILNGGVTSIKEQQLESERLETENYNLRIKLATITKFLNQTPEEQRELLHQNIDLKQLLMEKVTEIRNLQQEINNFHVHERDNEKENISDGREFVLKLEFEEMVDKYENELASLKKQDSESQIKSSDQVHELLIQLEKEKDEIRRIEQDFSRMEEKYNNSQSNEKALQLKIFELEEKIDHAEEINRSAIRKIELHGSQSNYETEKLYDEISDLRQQLKKSEAMKDEVNEDLSKLEVEFNSAKRQITSLENEVEHWKSKYQIGNQEGVHSNQQVLDQLNSARDEIRKLKLQVQDDEFDNNRLNKRIQELEVNDSESVRLHSKINTLNEELKKKDKEEYDLRGQINALIQKQNSDDSQGSEKFKYYQTQLDNYQAKELKLKAELENSRDEVEYLKSQQQKLKDQQAKYQDQQSFEVGSRIDELLKEKVEINDKLDFYEDEYSKLERLSKEIEAENEILKNEKIRISQRLELVEDENLKLVKELRKPIHPTNNKTNSSSALDELEAFKRQKLETEKAQLIGDVETLTRELQTLKRELDIERAKKINVNRYENSMPGYFPAQAPMTPTTPSNYQFNSMMEDKEDRIRELRAKLKKLETMVSEKDTIIDSLESKIRGLDRANKLNFLVDDEEKAELMKLKSSQASKIKILQLENENLQKELHAEIEFYKSKAQPSNTSTIALLEQQLKEAQLKKDEALSKFNDLNFKMRRFEKYEKENASLLEMISKLENNESVYKIETTHLETKINGLNQDLTKANQNCMRLAEKVRELKQIDGSSNEKYQQLQFQNHKLERRLESLQSKLDTISTAQTTSKHSMTDIEKIRIRDNELKYYKAKLYDVNLKSNDLQTMNDFILSSIKNSNQLLKDDIVKLTKTGIYPDYSTMRKKDHKLTFKVLAKFVLAGIRIKNRFERAEKRKLQLHDLKTEIEKAKIMCLD